MGQRHTYRVRTHSQAEDIVGALAYHDIESVAGESTESPGHWQVEVVVPPDQDEAVEGIVGRFDEQALRLD